MIFIVVVLAFLGDISAFFPEEGVAFGKRTLYFPTIENLLSGDSRLTSVLKRVQALEESLRLQRYQDSLYADSLTFYTRFFQESPSRICLPDNNWDYLNDFFAELDSCRIRHEIVHILHYGDSQIESDRITGYIRQHLQENFGGKGPGLLPAVQPIPTVSVEQSASENIQRYIVSGMHQNRTSHRRYGVLGQVGELNGESSISVVARKWKTTGENVKEFQTIRLFAGQEKNFKVHLTSSGKRYITEEVTNTASPVKVHTWNLSEPVSKFSLRLAGSAEIYGIAVDGISGVAVDNIPFRGSSGTFFSTLDSSVMACMFKELNTRLILLEFGGNMVPAIRNAKSIAAYRDNLSEQIASLRKTCPEAKILLIGPSDMSTKVNGKLCTYPYLESVVNAMKEAALANGAAFWNMYEVMGGNNSMIDWVKHSPALAAPDYVHFTPAGADRIAMLFCETLMVYYDYYRFVTENTSSKNDDAQ
ncbi:MAG: GDSL-type esterase/lipase family protein [Dysgonamonadaceae bacterium]|nr:GDSL-type esterase/lipase family protein [Dysgonamonadaceae bacterium]